MKQRRLKLNLLYDYIDTSWGGINTFFRNFSYYSKKDDRIELVDAGKKADIILTSGHFHAPGKMLHSYQLRNIKKGLPYDSFKGIIPYKYKSKVIFRLDGLRSIYSDNANSDSDKMLFNNMKYADAIVFQSKYSNDCFIESDINIPDKGKIILNGAYNNTSHYNSKDNINSSETLRLVSSSWSTNHEKGFKVISDFSKFKKTSVFHIGNWPKDVDTGNVVLLGKKNHDDIYNIMSKAHCLLFPSKNEACPNVVSEGLSTGLPVIYHPSGGTSELCGFGKYGVEIMSGNNNIEKTISLIRNKYSILHNNIKSNKYSFEFERCYKKYIKFFYNVV